jgi:hypothetical protein
VQRRVVPPDRSRRQTEGASAGGRGDASEDQLPQQPAKLLIAELERVREQRVLRPPVMLMRRAPNSNRPRAAGSVVASARRGQSLVRTGALL